MGLQKKVDLYRAYAVAGDKATPRQAIYFPQQLIAETEITVGNFCFFGTDPETQAKNTGTATTLVGLVERVINYSNYVVTSEGTLTLPVGSALTVAVRGDYYVTSSTVATQGQKVFVNTSTGAVSTGATGGTVAGSVETDWVVTLGGAIGEPVLISNWKAA